jgi:LysR family transcriptional activator of nhaA
VTRASEKLHVSQPTISGQIRELELALGEKLLRRSGRAVVLTDAGRTVYRYADEILALDRELLDAVKGVLTAENFRRDLTVGSIGVQRVAVRPR